MTEWWWRDERLDIALLKLRYKVRAFQYRTFFYLSLKCFIRSVHTWMSWAFWWKKKFMYDIQMYIVKLQDDVFFIFWNFDSSHDIFLKWKKLKDYGKNNSNNYKNIRYFEICRQNERHSKLRVFYYVCGIFSSSSPCQ